MSSLLVSSFLKSLEEGKELALTKKLVTSSLDFIIKPTIVEQKEALSLLDDIFKELNNPIYGRTPEIQNSTVTNKAILKIVETAILKAEDTMIESAFIFI